MTGWWPYVAVLVLCALTPLLWAGNTFGGLHLAWWLVFTPWALLAAAGVALLTWLATTKSNPFL